VRIVTARTGECFDSEATSGKETMVKRKIEVCNPSDKDWTRQRFVFWFGACAPTFVLAYGNGVESALEAAAEWLAENTPGHIVPLHGDEHAELMAEACAEMGLPWPMPDDADPDPYWQAEEKATADLTYTESGYLTSYEWGIALDNPEPGEISAFAHDRQ
jgi:hypothetical protein